MSKMHAWLYRRTGGRVLAKMGGQPVLLLTTTGRRSGLARTTPVQYVRSGDSIIVVAANHGAPRDPAWYANLVANPDPRASVGRACVELRARVAEGAERDRLWRQLVTANRSLTRTERRAGRRLPVVVLEPRRQKSSSQPRT